MLKKLIASVLFGCLGGSAYAQGVMNPLGVEAEKSIERITCYYASDVCTTDDERVLVLRSPHLYRTIFLYSDYDFGIFTVCGVKEQLKCRDVVAEMQALIGACQILVLINDATHFNLTEHPGVWFTKNELMLRARIEVPERSPFADVWALHFLQTSGSCPTLN